MSTCLAASAGSQVLLRILSTIKSAAFCGGTSADDYSTWRQMQGRVRVFSVLLSNTP